MCVWGGGGGGGGGEGGEEEGNKASKCALFDPSVHV